MLMMAILLCSLIAKSQINQVGQILNLTTGAPNYYYSAISNIKLIHLSDGYKYVARGDTGSMAIFGSGSSYLRIFGLNGNIIKTINLPTYNWPGFDPAGFRDYYLISDLLFDSDNEIEFIVNYEARRSGNMGSTPDTSVMYLMNESGNIIETITSNSFSTYGVNYFSDGSTFSKLLITNNQGILIYDLPGFLPCEACTNTTGISQNQFSNQENGLRVAVAPNPSSGEFNFSYQLPKGKSNAELIITNMNGVTAKSKKISGEFGTTQFNLSDLSSGIYIYSIYCDGEKSTPQRLLLTK